MSCQTVRIAALRSEGLVGANSCYSLFIYSPSAIGVERGVFSGISPGLAGGGAMGEKYQTSSSDEPFDW